MGEWQTLKVKPDLMSDRGWQNYLENLKAKKQFGIDVGVSTVTNPVESVIALKFGSLGTLKTTLRPQVSAPIWEQLGAAYAQRLPPAGISLETMGEVRGGLRALVTMGPRSETRPVMLEYAEESEAEDSEDEDGEEEG